MILWWTITLLISIISIYIGINLKQREYTNIIKQSLQIITEKADDNRQIQEHLSEIIQLKDKNKKIKKENEGLINKNHNLKNQIKQLKQHNKKIKKENKHLKTENKALIKKGQQETDEDKITKYKTEIQKLHKAIECKNNEIEILQNKKQKNIISEVLTEIEKEGIKK
jgi:predicted RNase H-like nuclease (RuvC/YqgF family)